MSLDWIQCTENRFMVVIFWFWIHFIIHNSLRHGKSLMGSSGWSATSCDAPRICGRCWKTSTMRTNQNWQACTISVVFSWSFWIKTCSVNDLYFNRKFNLMPPPGSPQQWRIWKGTTMFQGLSWKQILRGRRCRHGVVYLKIVDAPKKVARPLGC